MQSLYEENTELKDLVNHYKASIEVLNQRVTQLITERNKYRSQALMRQNRIEELLNGKES